MRLLLSVLFATPTEKLVSTSQWRVPSGDFLYPVEWRFIKVEGETKYNSGVFARTAAGGNTICFRAQAGPPANGGYFLYVNTTRKRTTLKSDMPSNLVKEPGEWNTYDIRAERPKVPLTVNGVETSHFDYDRLETYAGNRFRNLRIKELP